MQSPAAQPMHIFMREVGARHSGVSSLLLFFSSVHRRRFEESHVAQIKAVFPDAYTFRQEKDVPTFNSSIKKGSYQLTVQPIINTGQDSTPSWPFYTCVYSARGPLHVSFLTSVLRPE